jgi:CubicO group peptidase (beta-lactamase class C family)
MLAARVLARGNVLTAPKESAGTGLAAALVERIDALFAPFDRSDAPGLVVGVSRHGEALYRKAFGLASVQHGVANTLATRMRIGSTSKHFTCLCVLLLAEDGRLDLDAPCSLYLPELGAAREAPTLRQLMNHTSGLRCSLDLAFIANGIATQPSGWQLQRLASQQDVNFPPGEGQIYCNGGYQLLSAVVDRAAGVPFEDFLRQRVLEPLGMFDTEPVPGNLRCVRGWATPHVPAPSGGWQVGRFPYDEIRGEGSLVSTIDDMLRWLAHMNGPKRVGTDASWRQMLTPPTLRNGHESVYALGLYRHDYRGVEVIHHAGGVIGGNSQMLTVPAHGLDIALMVNGAACNAKDTVWKILDILLEGHLSPAPSRPALAVFQRMAGTRYHGQSGILIGFDSAAGAATPQLGLSLNGSVALPVLWDDGRRVFSGWQDLALGPLEFERDEMTGDGEPPATLTIKESGHSEVLRRVGMKLADADEVARGLIGDYRSHDLAAEAQIRREGDVLWMHLRGDYSGARRLRIKAWANDVFEVADPTHPMGALFAMTAELDPDRRVHRFRIDGIRARHVAFDRTGEQ